jgi:hypothetical protein
VSFGGAGALYPVYFPDVILPVNGATIGMEYGTFTGTTVVDGFEGIGQWRQPSFSGQTNADPSSTFAIVSSPTRTGTGSGRLNYVWGSGNYIRLYNQGLPQFPAASDFSSWMFGDNSGHQVRICLRDSDNDLFVTDWMIIDFTGWREILWEDIANNPKNVWVQSANGLMDGPNVRLDSIHVQKVTGLGSGNLYFDDATCTPLQSGGGPDGPVAAIQYDGESQVVYMGFPFETISSSDMRTLMMGRVLDFFGFVSPVPPPPTERDQIQVY